ncbi:MAG TPA: NAD-dependent epimerase/dehydratase family protein [Longimicrobiales bacterium]|nr:NAD-dependent epimerase/dehydratase family protein [Longimicrobiales bacterium]
MRIFVTGGTGYVGSAVVRELVAAEQHVTGLTRLAENAAYLEGLGAHAVLGDLRDAGGFEEAARSADVLVHVAAEESGMRAAVDRLAVEALLSFAREGEARQLVYTSGCFVLGETGSEPAQEDASTAEPIPYAAWRVPHERLVLEADTPRVATAVIRPGMVYGGKEGAFSAFFGSAEREGAAEFIGDGANRWSPVHRSDVGRLYRMVVEARARGIFHCAEPAARVGELAMAASRAAGAGGATRRLRVEDARRRLGSFADALTVDQVMGCRRSESLGWSPLHPPFREGAESVYREWKG